MLISLIVGMVLLLTAYNFFRIVRDALHPAVVFPAVWGVTITAIGLAEPFGYLQITPGTFLVFILGIFSFMVGALLGKKSPKYAGNMPTYNLDFKKIAWFCLALHAVMLPSSWVEINQITTGAEDIFASAYRLRAASVSGEEKVGALVGNYLTSGLFFVPVLLIGWLQKKVKLWMFVILTIPWVILNIFIGGRSGLITLIFSLIYVYMSMGRKISLQSIIAFGFSFIFVLIAGNLLVGKIDASIEDGVFAIARQSLKGFFDYFLQGLILFSEYYQQPNKISPTWDALVFPCQMLEKVSWCVPPSLHQGFMMFTNKGDYGNVYSIFFSIYPKYGWLGLFLISGIYGFWAKFHHARRHRSIFNLLIGGFLFSAILLSVFLDSFGTNIYFFVKIFLISSVASFAFRQSKNSSVNSGR